MIWIKSLLLELDFPIDTLKPMHYDNQTAIFIVNNPIFHECMRHIKIDCHYIRNMVMSDVISIPQTQSSEQLADSFTKDLSVEVFGTPCTKLKHKLGMLEKECQSYIMYQNFNLISQTGYWKTIQLRVSHKPYLHVLS